MSWPTISDPEVGVGISLPDVRARLSTQLFVKLRERDARVQQPIGGTDETIGHTSGSLYPWTTLATLRFYIPAHYVGTSGTRIALVVWLTMTGGGAFGMCSAQTRLVSGSIVSTTVFTSSGTPVEGTMIIDLPAPTPDAINELGWQLYHTSGPPGGGSLVVTAEWLAARGPCSYIAAIPR